MLNYTISSFIVFQSFTDGCWGNPAWIHVHRWGRVPPDKSKKERHTVLYLPPSSPFLNPMEEFSRHGAGGFTISSPRLGYPSFRPWRRPVTTSTPQLCKDRFDIQDGSSHVVLPMRISSVMLMKFSVQIQLGEEIMSSIFCSVFSLFQICFFVFSFNCNCNLYWIQYFMFADISWAYSVMHTTAVAWKLGHILLWFSILTCWLIWVYGEK